MGMAGTEADASGTLELSHPERVTALLKNKVQQGGQESGSV